MRSACTCQRTAGSPSSSQSMISAVPSLVSHVTPFIVPARSNYRCSLWVLDSRNGHTEARSMKKRPNLEEPGRKGVLPHDG